MTTLFDAFRSRSLSTSNRMVMAPMTRLRSTPDGLPTSSMARYYSQRASAGLIVTEGVQPSRLGQSNPLAPGLYNTAQVQEWRKVTSAVHAEGGKIFAQIMHGGRVSHFDVVGENPVGPMAIAPDFTVSTTKGPQPAPVPRALSTSEVRVEAKSYAEASARAIDAGFDGVELHGANGYLIQQFLASNVNQRDDRYGGSILNRIRFAAEAVEMVIDTVGADRAALRISPGTTIWGMAEEDVQETYSELLSALSPMGLAYLHVTTSGGDAAVEPFRDMWEGTLIINPTSAPGAEIAPGKAEGEHWLDQGADLVSFGRNFLANPDLVERFRMNLPLEIADPATFYSGGDSGYITYPNYQSDSIQIERAPDSRSFPDTSSSAR